MYTSSDCVIQNNLFFKIFENWTCSFCHLQVRTYLKSCAVSASVARSYICIVMGGHIDEEKDDPCVCMTCVKSRRPHSSRSIHIQTEWSETAPQSPGYSLRSSACLYERQVCHKIPTIRETRITAGPLYADQWSVWRRIKGQCPTPADCCANVSDVGTALSQHWTLTPWSPHGSNPDRTYLFRGSRYAPGSYLTAHTSHYHCTYLCLISHVRPLRFQ